MDIGRHVRIMREIKGLSQQGLADELGISQKKLSRIENGQVSPSLRLLEEISNNFGLTVEQLIQMGTHKLLQLFTGEKHEKATGHGEIKELYESILAEKERYIRSLEKQLEFFLLKEEQSR